MKRLLLFALCLAFVPAAPVRAGARETIDYVMPRVVKIFGAGKIRKLHGYSTGFLVSKEGHIVTVFNHVIDVDGVSVVLNDGRRFEADLLGAEPQLDIAILKIREAVADLPHFDVSQAGTAGVGTRILGFSNMFKVAAGDEPVSVLHGVIAAKTKLEARRGVFQVPYHGTVYIVDAITNNPGAAGGVITSRDGKLLGIIGKEVRNARSQTWINYAIPVAELKDVIGQIIRGEYVEKPKKPDADEDPNRYVPLDFGIVLVPDVIFRTPAYIETVAKNSAAERKGLKTDDLILFVGDELVQSSKELKKQFGLLEVGDTLRLIVRRKNKLVTVELPVEKKPEKVIAKPPAEKVPPAP